MSISPVVLGALAVAFRVFVAWQVVWGVIAFVTVWRDKVLASGNRRRVPERTLHRAEAWGGWLGSFVAQQVFRHKTRKATYQRVYRPIALCWLVAWVAVIGFRVVVA